MNRRDLDRLLLMGTALAAGWPGWLRRAFAAEARPSAESGVLEGEERWRQIVGAARRRAWQAGKPLLAFVVPEGEVDGQARWERGQAFGELLNHGPDETMATLALAEIVCAPVSALRTLDPGLPAQAPLMWLIETGEDGPRSRPLDAILPPAPEGWYDTDPEKQPRPRVLVLSRLLEQGLRATPRMLLERAAQARSRLGARVPALETADGAPAQLHRLAPILLAAAVGLPRRERTLAVGRIAGATRVVLCRRRERGFLDLLTRPARG
jgi:hypothetical protein